MGYYTIKVETLFKFCKKIFYLPEISLSGHFNWSYRNEGLIIFSSAEFNNAIS